MRSRSLLVLASCAALLAGCEGGTLTNYSQSCTSTSGLPSERTVTCSGQAETLSGSVGIEFSATPTTRSSSVPTGPLRVEAVVDPSGDSSVFFVDAGEGEVRGLSYEGRIEPV